MNQHFHFGVIGSGFSGSLIAWILASRGYSVVLVDRTSHPRFAIGESSTPLADFLLERIADQFQLPALRPLSRWGSWQRAYPQLRSGKKRGFSYYWHRAGEAFTESYEHENSWLVAASVNDELSDTHWMRSDVDHWFCNQAVASGVQLLANFDAASVRRLGEGWELSGEVNDEPARLQCNFLIDASGSGNVLSQTLELRALDDRMQTQTGALYGHFRNVAPMTRWLKANDVPALDDPFDGDDAAQHHWVGSGWLWFLRFADGTTSVGLVQPCANWNEAKVEPGERLSSFKQFVSAYPTVANLLEDAELIAPLDQNQKPRMGWLPRISRMWNQAAGRNWLMMPTTAGIIDPLHSTGIAHSLSGVLRAAEILTSDMSETRRSEALAQYSGDTIDEVRWIDRLVANCYAGAARNFESFAAAASLYFITAIHCERQMATQGSMRDGFLLARSSQLSRLMHDTELMFARQEKTEGAKVVEWMRKQIEPWNDCGLLDPSLHNRLSRSAAPKLHY